MSWFGNNGGRSLKKSQYYVWYLGSKEADGLRGKEHVLPVMRALLKESLRRYPNKITVQVSQKGLKLIQTVPTMSKSGKLKTELIKFQIPQHSLTFSMVGPPPFTDIVGCILLVFNPETKSPVHVHCYRCDSPETATFMNANLQTLLNRPDTQRRLVELERRLTMTGLLTPPTPDSAHLLMPSPTEPLGSPMTSSQLFAKAHQTDHVLHSSNMNVAKHQLDAQQRLLITRQDSGHGHDEPDMARRADLSSKEQQQLMMNQYIKQQSAHQHKRHSQALTGASALDLLGEQYNAIKASAFQSDDDELSDELPEPDDWRVDNKIGGVAPFNPNTKQRRLKKDLFYELKTKLETSNPSHSPERVIMRNKSSNPDYYPKADQNSPASAKDSSNTSTTSGLGSDFSSGGAMSSHGMAHSHHHLATDALMVAPGRPVRNADRRRFSVSDLHQAWRVDDSPSPISAAMYNQTPISLVETPAKRKTRYQKNPAYHGGNDTSSVVSSSASTSVNLNVPTSYHNNINNQNNITRPSYQPPIPPKSHSISQLHHGSKNNLAEPIGRTVFPKPGSASSYNNNNNAYNNNNGYSNNNNNAPQPQLRMFGDTLLKPGEKISTAGVNHNNNIQRNNNNNNSRADDISLPQLKERRRQWRSMDNLHVQMAGGLQNMQQQQQHNHVQAQTRMNHFAYHMNNTENDQFWRFKAMAHGGRAVNVLE